MKRHLEGLNLSQMLTEIGLTKFNPGVSVSSMVEAMQFITKAMFHLNSQDYIFFFQEDGFDLLLTDVRGNEFVRCVRTGDSSIYSGGGSNFMVWAKAELFSDVRKELFPQPR